MVSSSFLRHCDKTKTLPYSPPQFCLIGADGVQKWDYLLNLKVGNSTWKVRFNDWMFLQPGGILLNRAEVTRWGVKIGDVQISFNKARPD